MFDFLTLHPRAFGLDISDFSLKIAKLDKKGKFFNLSSFGEFSLEPGMVEKGEIKNEEALASIIKNSILKVQGQSLKTKYVKASLSEEKAYLEVIQLPLMEEEELAGAIKYEAENYIPLAIEEVYLDFQMVEPLFNHLDHLDVLIAAVPKKIVDSYLNVLKKAGLSPLALEVESQATARALVKGQIAAQPILIIDLGANRTSFIIFSGYCLRFTSSLPISGALFNQAIASTFNVDIKKAEELKMKYGLRQKVKIKIKNSFDKKVERGEVFEALIPVLTDLVEQIKKHLSFYQTHASHEHLLPNGKVVEKILLCGGGAGLKGMQEFLESELKIKVELANPWVNILPQPFQEIPALPLKESLKYATALGLALRND